MRKLLLAGVFVLVPFVAFARNDIPAGIAASGSLAGVQSTQGTAAGAQVTNGIVVTGAIAGNYTDMQTNGMAKAGDGKATTATNAKQVNVGGTITGGYADPEGRHGTGASGNASAVQNSQALGGSAAVAVSLQQKPHGRAY